MAAMTSSANAPYLFKPRVVEKGFRINLYIFIVPDYFRAC